ncbi:uncharacterized protein NPIL_188791 [Nephila pilipes]|uniref:Uncharacterized protein n=1 Tax=Nephila pilipes TaxID=299642 RepID=A0A8X6UCT5_NEPPI|nr:uncharacterized protein NPIL_188791 [Nephila pilipes]
MTINKTKKNSTVKSPFYLRHGYGPRFPREFHNENFINDKSNEDQLDFLKLARADATNSVYKTHLENKRRFDLHRKSQSFKSGDLVLYYCPNSEIINSLHFSRGLYECSPSWGKFRILQKILQTI